MSKFLLDIAPEPPVCRFVEDNSALILLIVSVLALAACGYFIYRYKKSH
ncbi:MAG: hypothetical protein II075_09170 [Bacteroidales bacterium]|nr:hypothetical protein [Bacteroidales bacterium]